MHLAKLSGLQGRQEGLRGTVQGSDDGEAAAVPMQYFNTNRSHTEDLGTQGKLVTY